MKKAFITTIVVLLLAGCAKEYVIINEHNDAFLYYTESEAFEYRETIRIIEDDVYYNVYFNVRYSLEFEGSIYQTFEEIHELIELIGPEELFKIGYRMEKIPVDYTIWERNFDMESYNY
jgi:hypothetical protein